MDLISWLGTFLTFINDTVIPVIIGLAFLFFVWNAFRFFILEGASPEGRESARQLMIWGILAFVIMVSVWGIVNILVDTFDIGRSNEVVPDYINRETIGF